MTEANTAKTIYGYSKPRLQSPSLKLPSAGKVVADLAADLGVPLLPHQDYLMTEALAVTPNGKWARSTIGAIMARQNGKTHAMRMRILAGMYVFGEKNIIAISQSRMLSLDTFRQVVDMAEGTSWTRKRIKRVSRTNGQEELEVYCHHYPKSCGEKCERIRKYSIKAATAESPRGATADLLWIDELREINQATWAAATPLTRPRPVDRVEDFSPWDRIKREKAKNAAVQPRIQPRFDTPRFSFSDRIYIGNTSVYARYALASPSNRIPGFVQGELRYLVDFIFGDKKRPDVRVAASPLGFDGSDLSNIRGSSYTRL